MIGQIKDDNIPTRTLMILMFRMVAIPEPKKYLRVAEFDIKILAIVLAIIPVSS